jgi:phosphoglycolate phosphatase
MIKNIIFDWSGVIKDAHVSHFWVVENMFRYFGNTEINAKEIKENYEEPYMNFWKKYFPSITIEQEQEVYKKFILNPDCPKAKPYRDIVKLIFRFKEQGINMAVLSSDFPETILPEIKSFGLENVFREVITFVHDKSEAIHEIMKRNNFSKDNTIFIGDTENEILAGKKVGIKTIIVAWGLVKKYNIDKAKPDFWVNNLDELENIILSK